MPLPGQPTDTPIPPHLKRWNWGAFFLSWIWGIGNSTYIALLALIPLVNFVMMIVLGIKGNEWAWKNRLWADEEHFRRTQRRWGWAGLIVVLGLVALVFWMFSLMKDNDAYRQSMAAIQSDARAVAVLGEPIEAGWLVLGNLKYKSDGSGSANLTIPVSGPRGGGWLFSKATRSEGVWTIDVLALKVDGVERPIVLIHDGKSTKTEVSDRTSAPYSRVSWGGGGPRQLAVFARSPRE